MARIRTIKPEFWEDEVVGSLSRDARLLFIACLNIADDEGLLRWSSPYIKSSAFMYDDDIGVQDCQQIMDELIEAQLFFSYNAGKSKQPFAYIVNFHKHQKINRPGPSRLPPPPLYDQKTVEMYRRRDGNSCHLCGGVIDHHAGGKDEFLISLDHIVPISKGGTDHPTNIKSAHQTCNKGRGNRTVEAYKELIIAGKTNAQARYPERFTEQFTESDSERPPADLVPSTLDLVSTPLAPKGAGYTAEFEKFWEAYPNKTAKDTAWRAWKKRKDRPAIEDVLEALDRYVKTKPEDINWKNPATWINGGCWNDKPPASGPATKTPTEGEDAIWKLRISGWGKLRFWNRDLWGPTPDEPGCNAPRSLITRQTASQDATKEAVTP